MTDTLPPLPPGFALVPAGGSTPAGPSAIPAPPPGFNLVTAPQSPAGGQTANDLPVPQAAASAKSLPLVEPMIGSPLWVKDALTSPLAGQAATGAVEGVGAVADLPATVETLLRSIGPATSNTLFGTDYAMPEPMLPKLGSNVVQAMDNVDALADEPDGLMETIFRRTGQELGASAVPVLGTASRAARPAVAAVKDLGIATGSGVGAGVANYMTGDDETVRAIFGDMAGQVVGGVGAAGLMGAARRAITPFPSQRTRQGMTETMANEGVDLTAGQRTGNKGLQYAESELGGAGAANAMEQQAEQFTQSALSRAGINAPRATPEVIDAAHARIGADFDQVAAQSTMTLDQQLATDVMGTLNDYDNFVPAGMQAPVIRHVVEGLSDRLNTTGMLDGPTYQAYRTQLDTAARGAAANPYLQDALYGIRNAMDDAVERGLAQTNPDLVPVWQQARNEYRNLIVLEDAASRAGESAALGLISPANLRNAVVQRGKSSYMRGNGDFADLARAGTATMTPLPNSGTAPRMAVRGVTAGIPGALGALAGNDLGGTPGALAGLAVGAAVPRVAGAAIMSKPVQAYLGNQLLRPSGQTASWAPLPAGALAQLTMDDEAMKAAIMQGLN